MVEEIKKEFDEKFVNGDFTYFYCKDDENELWQFIEQKLTESVKQAKIEENERFKTNFVKAIESAQDHGNILFNELNKYKGFNDWVGKNNKYDADKEDLRRFIISCFKLFASEIKCKILEPESTN